MPPTPDLLSFGPFLLDQQKRVVTRDGERVRLGPRQVEILCTLVQHAGQVVPKDTLIERAWGDVAVTTGSVDQALHVLRQTLTMPAGEAVIETRTRRGVCFVAKVTPVAQLAPHSSIDEVLSAHRAWIDGRAALETLDTGAIGRARSAFETIVSASPTQAAAHVGLANALALQFETARTNPSPDDVAALKRALTHAQQAVRLDEKYGEAWATLGFVLARVEGFAPEGAHNAVAAAKQSIVLEPDNWRHHLRLSAASWGEERLRAARQTLQLLPGLPMAHWLAATVLVARQRLDDAARELATGLDGARGDSGATDRFSSVGLEWLLGLVRLAQGDRTGALESLARELGHEHDGHLYAREVAANSWYAIGAARFHAGEREGAHDAWRECLARVETHPMARAALGDELPGGVSAMDVAIAGAVRAVSASDRPGAAVAWQAIERLLAGAGGNAGWLLAVEPILGGVVPPVVLERLLRRAA